MTLTWGVLFILGMVKILSKSKRWVQMLGYKWHTSWHFTGIMKVLNITKLRFYNRRHEHQLSALINTFIILNCCGKLYFGIIHFLISLFRLHNHNPPTYETGSTRKFLLGRTDTIRSASIASSEFVKAMVSPNKTVSIKSLHWIKVIGARAYPSFCGMKRLVVLPWTFLSQDARP